MMHRIKMQWMPTIVLLAFVVPTIGCSRDTPQTAGPEPGQPAAEKIQQEKKTEGLERKADHAAAAPAAVVEAPGHVAGDSPLAVPSDVDQLAPQDVVDQVRRLLETDSALPIPVDPKIPTSRDLAGLRGTMARRVYLEAFERVADKNARWYGSAHTFISRILAEDIGEPPRSFGAEASRRELLETGERLVNGGCSDPAVLHLYARLRFQNGTQDDIVAAQDASRKSVATMATQGYSHQATASAMLQFAEIAGRYVGWGPAAKEEHLNRAIPELAAAAAELDSESGAHRIFLAWLTARLQTVLAGKEKQLLRAFSENSRIDPWIGDMLLARQHVQLGWAARGHEFAGKVSQEQWKVFHAHLHRARALLLTAWKLHPDAPEAAAELVSVTMAAGGAAGETPRFWFNQAAKAEFGHLDAYARFRESLLSRWGGSDEALLTFGRECLATNRFETQVPWQFHAVVQALKIDSATWQYVFALAGVYDDYRAMLRGYRDAARTDDERNLWDSYLACATWLSGRNDEAREMLQHMGNRVIASAFADFRQPLEYARKVLNRVSSEGQPFGGYSHSVQLGYRPDSREMIILGRPDGRDRGVVRAWDPATGKPREQLVELSGWNNAALLSPDGRWLVLADDAGRVELWNLTTKKMERPLPAGGPLRSWSFAPDGKLLALARNTDAPQTSVTCWNLADRKPAALSLPAQRSPVVALAMPPGGRFLAAASASGRAVGDKASAPAELVLWDTASQQLIKTILLPGFSPATMDVSPDGRMIAVAGRSATMKDSRPVEAIVILLIDVESGKSSQTLRGQTWEFEVLRFISSGEALISGSGDGSIRFWDTRYGIEFAALFGHSTARIRQLCLSPANDWLFSSDEKGRIQRWQMGPEGVSSQVASGLRQYEFALIANELYVGKGNRFLATCDDKGGVALWDAAERFESALCLPGTAAVVTTGMAVSPDETLLATVGGNEHERIREVLVWDIATRRIRRRLEGHDAVPRCVAFSPDGKTLATGDATGKVLLWNVDTGIPWKWGRLREHQGLVTCLGFSPDGRTLITGSTDGSFKIWDLPREPVAADKVLISRVTKHGFKNGIEKACFAPDGRSFLTTSNGVAEIWDASTMLRRFTVPGLMATYAGDGSQFVTGGGQHLVGEARLWDASSGQELRRFPGAHSGFITALGSSPDGTVLFTAGRDRVYRCWDLQTGNEIQEFSAFPIRDLDPDSAVGRLFAAPAPAEDHDRKVAQWVVDSGGTVEIVAAGRIVQIQKPARLPFGLITVRGVNFAENNRIRSTDLTVLQALGGLRSIRLGATGIDDAAAEILTACKALEDVQVQYTKLTSRGVEQLLELPNLHNLDLSGLKIAASGFQRLKAVTTLDSLALNQTDVTDDDLSHLTAIKNLKHLHIRTGTKVTDGGAQRLKAALPGCEIH